MALHILDTSGEEEQDMKYALLLPTRPTEPQQPLENPQHQERRAVSTQAQDLPDSPHSTESLTITIIRARRLQGPSLSAFAPLWRQDQVQHYVKRQMKRVRTEVAAQDEHIRRNATAIMLLMEEGCMAISMGIAEFESWPDQARRQLIVKRATIKIQETLISIANSVPRNTRIDTAFCITKLAASAIGEASYSAMNPLAENEHVQVAVAALASEAHAVVAQIMGCSRRRVGYHLVRHDYSDLSTVEGNTGFHDFHKWFARLYNPGANR